MRVGRGKRALRLGLRCWGGVGTREAEVQAHCGEGGLQKGSVLRAMEGRGLVLGSGYSSRQAVQLWKIPAIPLGAPPSSFPPHIHLLAMMCPFLLHLKVQPAEWPVASLGAGWTPSPQAAGEMSM